MREAVRQRSGLVPDGAGGGVGSNESEEADVEVSWRGGTDEVGDVSELGAGQAEQGRRKTTCVTSSDAHSARIGFRLALSSALLSLPVSASFLRAAASATALDTLCGTPARPATILVLVRHRIASPGLTPRSPPLLSLARPLPAPSSPR